MSEPLTEAEHHLITKLGECWNEWAKILGNDRTRGADATEFVHHIHILQEKVMAQAAARTYPHLYRLAGETVTPHPYSEATAISCHIAGR